MKSTLPTLARSTVLLSASCLLLACARYSPLPLNAADDVPLPAIQATRVEADRHVLGLPPLPPHRFATEAGLDMTDIATLAVLNNPDLKLARADLAIAQAQAFDAGLLPDPQLALSQDWAHPAISGASSAYNAGVTIDLMKIITRAANKAAADATVRKTDLGLLWLEWQLVAQAKILFLKAQLQAQALPQLTRQRDLDLARYQAMNHALLSRNVTGDTLGVALLAYQDAETALADAQRTAAQTRHDLNALLGLPPESQLKLLPRQQLSDAEFNQELADTLALTQQNLAGLAAHRPDLLALKQGYLSEENKYRAAVLGQFPALQFGLQQARDTSFVTTKGYSLNLSLPIFNRNRGVIAIEKASRERLREEYHVRIDTAFSDIDRLREDIRLLAAQVKHLKGVMPTLDANLVAARTAYAAHNLDIGTYTDAETSMLARDMAVAAAQEALAEQRVALQALMGASIPDSFSSAAVAATGVSAP